ncbi:hypothetical protein TKK_0007315 [Trichogramma kaykai]|uniref:Peptidase S1 domain-containing protein n=1 Tax=Trichogramma kaykai TaxID=54128 RepID=A0ABD2X906_9HYME
MKVSFIACFFFLFSYTALSTGAKVRITPDGSEAEIEEFPYQILITLQGNPLCGGSLISDLHVLTAAHCVYKIVADPYGDIGDVKILVGSKYLGGGQSYNVRRISHHKDYIDETIDTPYFIPNDVAVIQLESRVTLSPQVQPISLPSGEIDASTPVVVTGYGSTVYAGQPSMVLRKLYTYTISLDECRAQHPKIILDSSICTDRFKYDELYQTYGGTCSGDSGGPLVDINKKMIIGVVSGGYGGCDSPYANVFARVSHFLPYIYSETSYYTLHPYEPSEHPSITNIFYRYVNEK